MWFLVERTLNVDDIQIFDVYFTGMQLKIIFLYESSVTYRLKWATSQLNFYLMVYIYYDNHVHNCSSLINK